jgi:hypothetical protein
MGLLCTAHLQFTLGLWLSEEAHMHESLISWSLVDNGAWGVANKIKEEEEGSMAGLCFVCMCVHVDCHVAPPAMPMPMV